MAKNRSEAGAHIWLARGQIGGTIWSTGEPRFGHLFPVGIDPLKRDGAICHNFPMVSRNAVMTRLYAFLPFFILAASFCVKTYYYLSRGTEYWLDEIVVTSISRQPLSQLFDTIVSEPHPPGFYLFLKLLPVTDMFRTRLILMVLSYAAICAVLLWGYRRRIIQRHNLDAGLALFFSTYTFLELTAHVRLEMLTTPLILYILLATIHNVENPELPGISRWIWLTLAITLLFFVGYIHFAFAVGLLALAYLNGRDIRFVRILGIQFALICAYFLVFGRLQYFANLARFSWLGDHFNSLADAFSVGLTGTSARGFWNDLPLLAFAVCVFLTYQKPPANTQRTWNMTRIALSVLAAASYGLHLYVRTRYSSFILLMACLMAGWALRGRRYAGIITFALVVMMSAVSLSSFGTLNVGYFRLSMADQFRREAGGATFGLLSDSASDQFTNKIMYMENDANIIPVNIYFPELSSPPYAVTRSLLSYEGIAPHSGTDAIEANFKSLGITNFFYLTQYSEIPGYFDPERTVQQVLDSRCAIRRSDPKTSSLILFIYRDCTF